MQVKTTRRYLFTSVMVALIKKKQKTSVCQGCGETGNMRIAGGNGKCAASMENSMEVPQKVHHRIMYPEIPLLSI